MKKIYFIADIGANHDGDLKRAKYLIALAAKAGADGVKFQSFKADKIVNRKAFDNFKIGHQKNWESGVYKTYKKYELPDEWIPELHKTCKKFGVDFLCTPYDTESVDLIDKYVPFHKIGSGDINYIKLLEKIKTKNKKTLVGCGASSMKEILFAKKILGDLMIPMQCNTNYTNNKENIDFLNLNTLKLFQVYFSKFGLSDHTRSYLPIIAAITLGANYIERHFTDRISESPDNDFAMSPNEFKRMVCYAKQTIAMLGVTEKNIEENEKETAIIQRRCLYATRNIGPGEIIKETDFIALRPCFQDALLPNVPIRGKLIKSAIKKDDYFKIKHIVEFNPRVGLNNCNLELRRDICFG